MEKRNKIILISLIIITFVVGCICVYTIIKNNATDAMKFKKEYMRLNNIVNESNGKTYPYVEIDDDNTIKYLKEDEVVELLERGTGVIYFGYNTCPWCRSLVTTLTSVGKKKNETIYYLNIENIRSVYKVLDGELIRSKDGSEGYNKIIELLSDILEDYYVTDEDGISYNTNEKRLYAPTVVAVKDGNITSIHVGTVESQNSGYDELNEMQKDVLEDIISDLINSKNDLACQESAC